MNRRSAEVGAIALLLVLSCTREQPLAPPRRSLGAADPIRLINRERPAPEQIARPQTCPAEDFYASGNGLRPPVVMTAPRPKPGSEVDPQVSKSGTVQIDVFVTSAGTVCATHIVQSLDPKIDAAFARAIQQWTFRAATLHGRPVGARYRQSFHINIQ